MIRVCNNPYACRRDLIRPFEFVVPRLLGIFSSVLESARESTIIHIKIKKKRELWFLALHRILGYIRQAVSLSLKVFCFISQIYCYLDNWHIYVMSHV